MINWSYQSYFTAQHTHTHTHTDVLSCIRSVMKATHCKCCNYMLKIAVWLHLFTAHCYYRSIKFSHFVFLLLLYERCNNLVLRSALARAQSNRESIHFRNLHHATNSWFMVRPGIMESFSTHNPSRLYSVFVSVVNFTVRRSFKGFGAQNEAVYEPRPWIRASKTNPTPVAQLRTLVTVTAPYCVSATHHIRISVLRRKWSEYTKCSIWSGTHSYTIIQYSLSLANSLESNGNFIYNQFHTQKFYVLPTQCICVFCVDLRTNSDYFTVQH
jgi:hypothetical protein